MTARLPDEMIEFWGEPIHIVTRQQLIADGQLVDVTEAAGECGFRGESVAVSASVWAMIESIPGGQRYGSWGDVRGRLHDVLWMARRVRHRLNCGPASAAFPLIMPVKGSRKRNISLVLHLGAGDDGLAAWTIMQVGED